MGVRVSEIQRLIAIGGAGLLPRRKFLINLRDLIKAPGDCFVRNGRSIPARAGGFFAEQIGFGGEHRIPGCVDHAQLTHRPEL